MLGRYVGRRIEKEGAEGVFAGVPSLVAADVTFGNLECVLSKREFAAKKRILLRGVATSPEVLKRGGFDILSVANNHALDAGLDGRQDTESNLAQVGIRSVGGSRFAETVTVRGLRVAFLAYSEFSLDKSDGVIADEIRAIRGNADVVVVSWHWGAEMSSVVTERQRALANLSADAGADLVVGHHPHVLQPVEWMTRGSRRCLVAFSLGNFVFDAKPGSARDSAILHTTLSASGVQDFRLESVQISGGFPKSRQSESPPRLLTER